MEELIRKLALDCGIHTRVAIETEYDENGDVTSGVVYRVCCQSVSVNLNTPEDVEKYLSSIYTLTVIRKKAGVIKNGRANK